MFIYQTPTPSFYVFLLGYLIILSYKNVFYKIPLTFAYFAIIISFTKLFMLCFTKLFALRDIGLSLNSL